MSAIIVKNLPHGIKEEKLRGMFTEIGEVTNCSLKFTPAGVFRKFGFIGFKSADDAAAAVKHFNKSYINTSQIVVDLARDIGDGSKPQAWSKYSKDSSAYRKLHQDSLADGQKKAKQAAKEKKDKLHKLKIDDLLGDLKNDEGFEEFLEAHKSRSNKAIWSNDAQIQQQKEKGDEDRELESASVGSPRKKTTPAGDKEDADETEPLNAALTKDLSDLDYLRSKKVKQFSLMTSECEEAEKMEKLEEETTVSPTQTAKETEPSSDPVVLYIIRMRGLPTNVNKKQIDDFFRPLVTKAVRIPRTAKGNKASCLATVEFNSQTDWESAICKNKNFIGPHRIYLHKMKEELKPVVTPTLKPWQVKLQNKAVDENEETLAESGRIFVRNLANSCVEEDLEKLFAPFGLLSEVHLPINYFARKNKGFAFVTFVMPEHAVQAYTQLDGTTFQGRLIHLLPGQEKREEELTDADKSSFKKQKELKQKKSASSSHNWNSLFMSSNAVVNVMAERYGTSKSDILDMESRQSLGVRLALGETQVVAETRQFLLDNDVCLDSFSQAAAPRSKTVILVKNLPANTKHDEMTSLFAPFGRLGRIVLPPSGITAIVEFVEPSEARNAFRGLAYSKFQHTPLYLEWAAVGVFTSPVKLETPEDTVVTSGAAASEDTKPPADGGSVEMDKEDDKDNEDEDDGDSEPGSVLFVKNISFDSTEESLKKIFSSCGKLLSVTISKKKDLKNPGEMLSMGYGFVHYKKAESAQKALKQLQHTPLDGHDLELKMSHRETTVPHYGSRKKQMAKKPKSTKILIRNIPFEAQISELRELFTVFGEVKSLRLPKKLNAGSSHRGFGFVDFLTLPDAKRAFNALCHSTHLYGRRLVLEWADTEETVDQLREKTARHFHDDRSGKRLKKSSILDDLNPSREFT